MKLPYQFTLGKTLHTVHPVASPGRVQGTYWWEHQHISIAVKCKGKQRKPQDIAETFWHEVTHAILRDMDHPEWADEHFVTAFSKRLTQVIYTARFS